MQIKKTPLATAAKPSPNFSRASSHKESDPRALAVYIHWPFCVSKCPYCDFNSHVASRIDHQEWREAYHQEIRHYQERLGHRELSSIFFGGGTPSLMEPETVKSLLTVLREAWSFTPDIEITLEANPSSVEATKLAAFREAGINRLSLGVQSFDDAALKFLGRAHNSEEALRALDVAARTFPRFSFDLIYARHGQTEKSWEEELRKGLALTRGHLSLYQLTLEPNTQFYTLAKRGVTLTLPEEAAAAMYEATQAIMESAGLPAYEISNHARAGDESRHNLTYWRYDDYIGIGPGAHGRHRQLGTRYAVDNHRSPEFWLKNVRESGHGVRLEEALDQKTAAQEAAMMGLRLKEGLSRERWQDVFGVPLEQSFAEDKIARLVAEGYLMLERDAWRTTAAGAQRLNALLSYLFN